MITSNTKVAYTFKKGQIISLHEAQHITALVGGLPWYKIVQERFESQEAEVTRDTTLELSMTQNA